MWCVMMSWGVILGDEGGEQGPHTGHYCRHRQNTVAHMPDSWSSRLWYAPFGAIPLFRKFSFFLPVWYSYSKFIHFILMWECKATDMKFPFLAFYSFPTVFRALAHHRPYNTSSNTNIKNRKQTEKHKNNKTHNSNNHNKNTSEQRNKPQNQQQQRQPQLHHQEKHSRSTWKSTWTMNLKSLSALIPPNPCSHACHVKYNNIYKKGKRAALPI